MSQRPLIHDIPQDNAASLQGLTAGTRSTTTSGATLFAVTDESARTISQATSPNTRAAADASDVAATLAEITSGVLAVVATAQYASIAWARGRWLIGRAPTDPVVATLDVLQAILGQGPCLDALRTRRTVTITDMGSEQRWPAFAAGAGQVGVGSMMSLPLSVRQESFGVVNLYAIRPDAFTGDDEAIAAVFATHAAIALLRAAERDSVGALAGLVRRPQTPRRSGRRETVSASSMDHRLRVTCDNTADAVVVRASGEVDLSTASRLGAALRDGCVAAGRSGMVVLDLSGIRFFSAGGLTLLLTTKRYCLEQQITLRLVATHRSVLRLLEITKLEALFDVVSTMEEATRPSGSWASTTRLHATPES